MNSFGLSGQLLEHQQQHLQYLDCNSPYLVDKENNDVRPFAREKMGIINASS